MAICGCEAASQRQFTNVRDGIGFGRTSVLRDAVEIARSEEKWLFLIRCGACGRVWAEGCWSSGHMDIYYISSVPSVDDPVRWLRESAAELPWDQSGPRGSAPLRDEPA